MIDTKKPEFFVVFQLGSDSVCVSYFKEMRDGPSLFQTWAEKLFGEGAIFVPIIVACSVFGSANGGAFVNSRLARKKCRVLSRH